MFTGIVETTGIITDIRERSGCRHLTISPQLLFTDLIEGESISVNGVCLTVTKFTLETFKVTVVPETRKLTNLNGLKKGSMVNLERALLMSSRLGGHLIQGHVDAMGKIIEMGQHRHSSALLLKIQFPPYLSQYIINKGFISLDGMSITIIDVKDDWFTVTLIPHTQKVTISKFYEIGTQVNLEIDMMGKYIEKLIKGHLYARQH